MQILAQVLEEITNNENSGRRTLVAFDLDSTLYDLTLRVTSIVETFAADRSNQERWPHLCEKLKSIEIRRSDWGLHEPLSRIGIDSKGESEFMTAIMTHWSRGFFSNDFLDRDFPLPGAVDFVVQCLTSGADVLYLTGRDVKRMGEGTAQSLNAQGFPLDNSRACLVLKPVAGLDDADFKADVMVELAKRYDSIWLFENEPVNINRIQKRVPKVQFVYIDTCHSGLEEVHESISKIPHFDFPWQQWRR